MYSNAINPRPVEPPPMTPTFNHFWMDRRTRRSAMRCSINLISPPWSMVSKNPEVNAVSKRGE